jgi:hypothetical protein
MGHLYADDEVERTAQPGEVTCRDCAHPIPRRSLLCPDCGSMFPAGSHGNATAARFVALVLTLLGMRHSE